MIALIHGPIAEDRIRRPALASPDEYGLREPLVRARGHFKAWRHAHVIAVRIDRFVVQQTIDHFLRAMTIAVVAHANFGPIGGFQEIVRVELESPVRPDVGIVSAGSGQNAALQLRPADFAALGSDEALFPTARQRPKDDPLAKIDPNLEHKLQSRLQFLIHLATRPMRDTRRATRSVNLPAATGGTSTKLQIRT